MVLFWQPIGPAQTLQFGSDTVTEQAETLAPRTPPTPEEADRNRAASQYAYGRMLLQRDDQVGALRTLQRAYRCDPSATMIIRDIVPLASILGRHAEAARYAVLAAERDGTDPDLLRQLGEILVEQGQFERALRLFDRAWAVASESGPREASTVLLRAEMGRLYLLTNKYEQAAEALGLLREALVDPDRFGFSAEQKKQLLAQRDKLYPLIGESFVRVKRFDEAAEMFRKAQEAQSNAPVLAFQLARIAVERQDWKSAREHLEQYFAMKSAVAGTQPYELLGQVIAGEGKEPQQTEAEVIARLSQLQAQDQKNVALGYFLADTLLKAGRTDQAAQLYVQLLTREPTANGIRGLARIYREKGDAAGMLPLLEIAMEKTGSLEVLGPEREAIAKNAALFQRLVEQLRGLPAEPTDRGGYAPSMALALLAIAAGEPKIVEEMYERALAHPKAPHDKIHEAIGVALLLGDHHQLAAKVFARAIAGSPPKEKLAPYYFYLAGAYELAEQKEAALEAAEKCAQHAPDSVQFQTRPAWVLYHRKDYDQAEQRYRDVLAKFDKRYESEETRDQLRQARLILSNICVQQGRLSEAEEWLEQVLDEFPEDAGAQNDLGYLWADQNKNLHRALAMCQRAVQSEPENGAYRDSLGWAYYRVGRFAEAAQELEHAAKLSPDGVIFDHLGDAYLKADQLDKAIDSWQKAVNAFTRDKDAEKLQQTKAKLEQHRK